MGFQTYFRHQYFIKICPLEIYCQLFVVEKYVVRNISAQKKKKYINSFLTDNAISAGSRIQIFLFGRLKNNFKHICQTVNFKISSSFFAVEIFIKNVCNRICNAHHRFILSYNSTQIHIIKIIY